MVKWILIAVAAFALVIVGLSSFLAPNDLSSCDAKPSTKSGCEKADAIVAVSGGDTSARTKSAIELYKNGWADKVIFSGAAADPNSESNAAAMRKQAIAAGVPESAILLEESSRNTRENASNTQAILKKHNIKNVILTTSPYHERRATMEFRAAANSDSLTVRSKPADDASWNWWWLKPSGWWRAISELTGIIVVGFRGTF